MDIFLQERPLFPEEDAKSNCNSEQEEEMSGSKKTKEGDTDAVDAFAVTCWATLRGQES
jgi:hypothetical protein